jgi:flagellar motor switch protein FliG
MIDTKLTGPQKAALLLLQLGKERSARVLRSMGDAEVEMLMAEVANVAEVHSDVMQDVMAEFVAAASTRLKTLQGGMGFVKDVLEEGLGMDRARKILGRIDGSYRYFEFLAGADQRQVLMFLSEEHPQTVALVLAHVDAELAASLLADLPPELGGEVARRIAVMDPPSPEVVRHIEDILERKLAALAEPGGPSLAGGVQPLVDILNRSTPAIETAILAQLDALNHELAEEVRRKMFIFEDIVKLDDRAVQLLLREVDSKELALALKGVKDEAKTKVMGNLSERAAANLGEEIELLGPVRMQDVELAREAIVKVIRTLEESGQIVLSRGGDDFVE